MKHCNLCGRAVAENEYHVFKRANKPDAKGLVICADCQRDQPRCVVCQTPMLPERSPYGICRDCIEEGLRCRSCGAPIRGEFLLINGSDGPYCADCFKKHAPCDICGAPAIEGSLELADHRIVCARCRETAITDPREANALFERVIDLIGGSLGLTLNIRPELALVDHARLAELSRLAMTDEEHDRAKVMGLFIRNGRKRFIYLQEYLPRIFLIQIVAHEFAHAWQGEKCPLMADPVMREGIAEWVAFHALLELDAKKKAAQMLQRRDIYGEGLRRLLAIEKRGGIPAVLDACKRAGNLNYA